MLRVTLPPSARLVVLLTLLGASSLAAAPAGKRKITLRELNATKVPAALSFSPDGGRLAFALRSLDEEHARFVRQIHVRSLPDGPTRQFTYREGGASEPRWSPDGRWLAFVAKGEGDEGAGGMEGDEEGPPRQVFLMPADGGEARQLTTLAAGVEWFEWRPDGSGVVVMAEEAPSAPDKALKERDLEAKNDGLVALSERRRHQFWSVGREDGAARRLNDGNFGVEPPFSISPDGRSVVYGTNLTGAAGGENDYDLYLLDLAAGRSRRLTERQGSEKSPRFSPDGRQVAFLAPAQADVSFSRTTLFVVPSEGGDPHDVSGRSDRDIDEEETIQWTPDGQAILAAVHRGTDQPIWRFDVASGEGREVIGGRRVCTSVALGLGGRIAFVNQGPADAPEIHLAAADGSGPRQAGDLNPQARDWEIAESAVIRWKSFDGKEVEGILVKPPGTKPGQRVPLLVYPHGGPQWRDPNILVDDRQAYAAEGYAVLLAEFRGSTGYGNAWAVANMKDLGGGDFRDLMAGVDKVIEMGVADPERLGIFGGSYGGYMTNWTITQTQRFKGAVSWYGIWNLVTDFSNSFYPKWEPDYLRSSYWDDWESYLTRSPARYVKKVATPVLILHGEEDNNTNLANSREMWTALRDLGKPVEFVSYPREGHGFEEPNHLEDVFRRTLRHMDRHVRGGIAADAAPGETVAAGGLELLVASVERRDDLAGRAPRPGSVFLAVTLVIKETRPHAGTLSVRVGGGQSEVRLVDTGGKERAPVGALAPALGETMLFAGEGDLSVAPQEDGVPRPLSAVLVFEVPDRHGRCSLKVKDFGPVRFDLPAPDKE
jgi:dipeptidyl aminopeptidase/acylaminoacyl peptidase